VLSALRFDNPVLQHEVRGKFRMRQPPAWLVAFEVLLGAGVLYLYLHALWWALFDPSLRQVIWWVVSFIGLVVVMIAAAVMGAGAFSREREIGTWEALNLSLLTPHQIIQGKLVAPLMACLVYSAPVWPLLIASMLPFGTARSPDEWDLSPWDTHSSISLFQAAGTIVVVAITAWCYTLWGMFWSLRCRATAASVGWTLGTLFMLLVVVQTLLLGALLWSVRELRFLADVTYNPLAALGLVAATVPQQPAPIFKLLSFLVILSLTGVILLCLLHHGLRAQIREHDRRRR
jgi:hypothetical protein